MKKTKFLIGALSFLIPFGFLLFIGFILGLTPFGDSNLMISDMGAQYMPFLSWLRTLALGAANPFYSFSLGMGDAVVPFASYYLFSPFNLLLIIFGKAPIDAMIFLVIILKIAAAGASMQFYLAKTYKKTEAKQLVFSFSYAVCAFVGVYLYNIMWLDALIFLPLVILSLQRLVETGKGALFSLALLGTIVTNYYMGYMICLFVFFYYFYWSMRHTEFASIKEYFRRTRRQLLRFVQYAVLGVLMAAVLLIPTAVGMLQTGKVDLSPLTFAPIPKFGPEFLMQLGLDNTDFFSRLTHLPSFYVGSLTIFLCALYFQMPFRKKEKLLNLALLLIVFLSFFIQTFNSVWHLFQMPIGFHFRNSYLLSFLLVVIAYETFLRRSEISRKMLFRTFLGFAALLLAGYAFGDWFFGNYLTVNYMSVKPYLLALSLALFLINAVLLSITEAHTNRRLRRNNPRYKSDNGKKIAAVALLTLLLIDSGFNFYQMTGSIQFGRASQLAAYQKTLSAAIRSVEQQPRTAALYRIQNNLINPTLSYYNENADYNNSLLIPYYGINSYTSTLNSRLLETLQSLGLYSQNVRCINDTGLTAFSSYLLNVNYEITPYPPGFGEPVIKDNVDGNYILQKNETSSSIGYVLPGIEKVQIDQMEPFKNQDRIAQTVLKDPDLSLFTPVTTSAAGNDIWTATAGAAGGLYIYLPEYTQWEMTVTVNGQEESQISGGSADLVQVTRVAKGDKISLAFTGENIPGLPSGALQILNHDALDKAIGGMDAGRADLAYDQRQNIFKGTVNAPESGTLFLSIPYDSQWQVLVDGKQAPAKAVLGGAFIGVDLTGGHHSLEIYYMPKTLILSAVVSAAAVLCLIVLRRIHLRKIKQN